MVDLTFFDGKTMTLTAVDTSKVFPPKEGSYYDEPSNSIAFTLDGVTYAALDDPDDGYRSMLREIRILPPGEHMTTPIPPHKVTGELVEMREGTHCYIIVFRDTVTHKPVLVFGTEYSSDYYPCFIGEFYQEGLAANAN